MSAAVRVPSSGRVRASAAQLEQERVARVPSSGRVRVSAAQHLEQERSRLARERLVGERLARETLHMFELAINGIESAASATADREQKAARLGDVMQRRHELAAAQDERRRAMAERTAARHEAERQVEKARERSVAESRRRTEVVRTRFAGVGLDRAPPGDMGDGSTHRAYHGRVPQQGAGAHAGNLPVGAEAARATSRAVMAEASSDGDVGEGEQGAEEQKRRQRRRHQARDAALALREAPQPWEAPAAAPDALHAHQLDRRAPKASKRHSSVRGSISLPSLGTHGVQQDGGGGGGGGSGGGGGGGDVAGGGGSAGGEGRTPTLLSRLSRTSREVTGLTYQLRRIHAESTLSEDTLQRPCVERLEDLASYLPSVQSACTLPPAKAASLGLYDSTESDDDVRTGGGLDGGLDGGRLGGASWVAMRAVGTMTAAAAAKKAKDFAIRAAYRGDATRLARCIFDHPDAVLSATDSHGRAPLHVAAGGAPTGSSPGHLECIRLLVAAGADVDAADGRQQRTALHEAVRRGHANAAALLVDLGACTDALDSDMATPLTLAMRGRRGRGDPHLTAALGRRTRPSA